MYTRFNSRRSICFIAASTVLSWLALAGSSAPARAQVLGVNLIHNGDAEAGSASDGTTPVATIPSWTRTTGTADVVAYDGNGSLLVASDPAPVSRGKNYFVGGQTGDAVLTQTIDISSASASIDTGTAVFNISGYLGGAAAEMDTATITVAFLSGGGQTLKSATIGPVDNSSNGNTDLDGLLLQSQLGVVPVSARKVTVTLELKRVDTGSYNNAGADGLSLVLNMPGETQSLLGTNLIVNPGAEAGPPEANENLTVDIPGWSRTGQFDVVAYTDSESDLSPTTDGGNNHFTGGPSTALSVGYQYIDVSGAASLVDKGTVQYALAAELGGYSSQEDNAVLDVQFQDWSGNVLGEGKLGPVTAEDRDGNSGLLPRSTNGAVPAGTRRIYVTLTMTRTAGSYDDGLADNLSLTLSSPGSGSAPAIASGGVVSASAFGKFAGAAPGSFVEIYGTNLASTTADWGSSFTGGNAPTSLGGVTVKVGGQPAFVAYVSSSQVNALLPSILQTGSVQLTVTNEAGTSAPYTLNINATEPGLLAPTQFVVNGKQYAGALFPDYKTFAMPSNAIAGVPSRPAKAGDTLIIYALGFGPVTPNLNAGVIVTQNNTLAEPFTISVGGVQVKPNYDGLAPNYTGLYQINIQIPANVPTGDAVPLTFTLNGTAGAQTLYIAIQ